MRYIPKIFKGFKIGTKVKTNYANANNPEITNPYNDKLAVIMEFHHDDFYPLCKIKIIEPMPLFNTDTYNTHPQYIEYA